MSETYGYSYDNTDRCLRINDEDISRKLSKHQMSENYLLGVPFEVKFIDDESPK